MSGVNCCNSHGDSGAGDVIDFHQYLGPASPAPSGDRVAIDGEHGGFGLKTANHMWFGDGQAYEMEPDSATLTAKYVANQQDVLTSAQYCGISGSICTQAGRHFSFLAGTARLFDLGERAIIGPDIVHGIYSRR